jgi:exodeoxyribonuclease-3
VRAHLENLVEWLRAAGPDVVLLQEIKCESAAFPSMLFEDEGYSCAVAGQKSYNGVAILARGSIEDVSVGLPSSDDPQARYIEAVVDGGTRVACVYAPNGDPVGSGKYDYKLEWMKRLNDHLSVLARRPEKVIVGGDFNVVRRDDFVYDPAAFRDSSVMQPRVRELFEESLACGFRDAWEMLNPGAVAYTYFDYRGAGAYKDKGFVLDYFLVGEMARPSRIWVDKAPRLRPRSSDHAPLVMEME